jgi:peptidoglycan/LPS O-acetylase OafA/YrhL
MNDHVNDHRRIAYLDGWRGIAIILVLIGHFFPAPGINLGTLGVDFFFVLSGRLMADILFIKKTALPKFFMRRFSRVYPALLAFVFLAAAIFQSTVLRVKTLAILSALTFTTNYTSIYFHRTPLFDHLWSLCVEEHSYFLLGFFAYLSRRKIGSAKQLILATCIFAIINGVIQSAILGHDYVDVYWRTDVQCAPIFLAAYFYLYHRQLGSPYITPFCLLIGILLKENIFPVSFHYSFGTLLLALSVAALDSAPALVKKALSLAPLRQAGLWSYSLYLWQQPFYKLVEDNSAGKCAALLGAVAAGIASFYLVEQPLRRFINHRIEK